MTDKWINQRTLKRTLMSKMMGDSVMTSPQGHENNICSVWMETGKAGTGGPEGNNNYTPLVVLFATVSEHARGLAFKPRRTVPDNTNWSERELENKLSPLSFEDRGTIDIAQRCSVRA
jgi:hypothetical protein